MYDVLCVGSATVDHFLTVDQKFSTIHMGDKLMVPFFEVHTGGGATNSAVALKELGFKVRILTKLGKDHNSQYISAELKRLKINNICTHKSKVDTDFSNIISSKKEKDRLILVHKGASAELTSRDFNKRNLKAKWIYMGTLVGKSFETAKGIAKYATKKKINLLFNPSLYLAKKGKKELAPILKATTVLILNKQEAEALLRKASIKKLLKGLSGLGPEIVVITDGSKRLHAYHEGKIYSLVPPKVKIVQTAGAGDAFSSGFLAGLLLKYSFDGSLRLGQLNASSVIQHVGTKDKLLSRHEIMTMMHRHNIKVSITKC